MVYSVDRNFAFDFETLPHGGTYGLVAHRFTAQLEVGASNYTRLFEQCGEESRQFREALFAVGYRLLLFLVGPSIENRRARFPRYALSLSLSNHGIHFSRFNEIEIISDASERTIGLYDIHDADFVMACEFLSAQPWAIMTMSRASVSEMDLDDLYWHALGDEKVASGYYPAEALNWRQLSGVLCPRGDTMVKTVGRFDDPARAIVFIQRDHLLM